MDGQSSIWRGPNYPFRPGISSDVSSLQKQLDALAEKYRRLSEQQSIPGPQGPAGVAGPPGPQGPPGVTNGNLASRVEVLERNQKEILDLMQIQRETTARWDRENKSTQEALRLMAERIGQLGSQPRQPVTVQFKDASGNIIARSKSGPKGIVNFRVDEIRRLLNGGQ